MSKDKKNFDLLTGNIYSAYDELMSNNKKIRDNEKIKRVEDLIKVCKKYPNAFILCEQDFKINEEDYYINMSSYPEFHFRKLNPINRIIANEKIIILSYTENKIELEAFNIDKLKIYNHYLKGESLLKIIKKREKNHYFVDTYSPLMNNYINKYYFDKNNWENMYSCDQNKYTNIYAGYVSTLDTNIFILDSHY